MFKYKSVNFIVYFLSLISIITLIVSCQSTDNKTLYNEIVSQIVNEKNNPVSNINPPKTEPLLEGESILNEYLPEKITIKTLSQTFATGYEFTLYGGKIWYRKSNSTVWKLFLKTGLPFSKWKLFPTPKNITEIAADGDILIAFDDEGKMYECFLYKSTIEKPFVWKNVFGWPKKQVLKQEGLVKNKRGWGMGVRRKDILYYTDIFGNDHHYGTMGLETLYFLSENGQEIRFTDSGLPPDFSKAILGPERGSFIAENISVSGSTIFLINNKGEMYTRLIDFDTMGCDPMWFKYTYIPYKQNKKGTDYLSNYTPWGLPNEDWKKQPDIVLEGKAKLSKYISIFQTGRGNDARELRVAGCSSDGTIGYYRKMLTEERWLFIPSNLKLDEDSYLNPEEKSYGDKLEYSYSGFLSKNGTIDNDITISTDNMVLTSEGDCTININYKNEETKSIKLYLVEMWTYVERLNPGLDGTPRNYFVTPTFDEKELASDNEDFNDFLQNAFGQKNNSIFSITADATNNYLELHIESDDKKNSYQIFLTKDKLPDIIPSIYKITMLYEQPILKKYQTEVISLDKEKVYTEEDRNKIEEAIKSNENYKKILQRELDNFNKLERDSTISRWGYNLLDLLTSITLLDQINFPKIKTLTSYGNTLMKKNAEKFTEQASYRMCIYPHIISLLNGKIYAYKCLLNDLSKHKTAKITSLLKDNYIEYMDLLGLPKNIHGKKSIKDEKDKFIIYRTDELPLFSGFFGNLDENHLDKYIGIIINDLPITILKSRGKNIIEFDVNYLAIDKDNTESDITGLSIFSKRTGKLYFDGNSFLLSKRLNAESQKTLFIANIDSSNGL